MAGERSLVGHEASFARTIAQTFRRRFHSGISHSICSVEVVPVGHSRRSAVGVVEAASGCIIDIPMSAVANDSSRCKRIRTRDPKRSFASAGKRRSLRPLSSQALSICELSCLSLSRRNVEHPSSFRNRAVTQGHDQHGAVAKESADVRYRPTAFVWRAISSRFTSNISEAIRGEPGINEPCA